MKYSTLIRRIIVFYFTILLISCQSQAPTLGPVNQITPDIIETPFPILPVNSNATIDPPPERTFNPHKYYFLIDESVSPTNKCGLDLAKIRYQYPRFFISTASWLPKTENLGVEVIQFNSNSIEQLLEKKNVQDLRTDLEWYNDLTTRNVNVYGDRYDKAINHIKDAIYENSNVDVDIIMITDGSILKFPENDRIGEDSLRKSIYQLNEHANFRLVLLCPSKLFQSEIEFWTNDLPQYSNVTYYNAEDTNKEWAKDLTEDLLSQYFTNTDDNDELRNALEALDIKYGWLDGSNNLKAELLIPDSAIRAYVQFVSINESDNPVINIMNNGNSSNPPILMDGNNPKIHFSTNSTIQTFSSNNSCQKIPYLIVGSKNLFGLYWIEAYKVGINLQIEAQQPNNTDEMEIISYISTNNETIEINSKNTCYNAVLTASKNDSSEPGTPLERISKESYCKGYYCFEGQDRSPLKSSWVWEVPYADKPEHHAFVYQLRIGESNIGKPFSFTLPGIYTPVFSNTTQGEPIPSENFKHEKHPEMFDQINFEFVFDYDNSLLPQIEMISRLTSADLSQKNKKLLDISVDDSIKCEFMQSTGLLPLPFEVKNVDLNPSSQIVYKFGDTVKNFTSRQYRIQMYRYMFEECEYQELIFRWAGNDSVAGITYKFPLMELNQSPISEEQ